MVHNLHEKLSVEVECFGILPFDPGVRRLVRERGVVLRDLSDSPLAQGIERISDRVLRLWRRDLAGSLERLLTDSRGWLGPDASRAEVDQATAVEEVRA